MGKSSKSRQQPNAPDIQQILLQSPAAQQPPHNPYYHDPATNYLVSPPPYSDIPHVRPANYSVPMASVNSGPPPSANYPQIVRGNLPRNGPVVIHQHQPISHYDRKAEKYHRKVRKFNNEMILVALIAIGLSVYANSLYDSRPCINFLVHQPTKDLSVSVFQVRDMHLYVAYGSVFVLFLALAKAGTGKNKSYSCYLFLMGLATFAGTLFTGYLAYLAFYTPCTLKISRLISSAVKSIIGGIDGDLPRPDRGLFGEVSVFESANEDKQGVWIFVIDLLNFTLYLSGFITSTLLC